MRVRIATPVDVGSDRIEEQHPQAAQHSERYHRDDADGQVRPERGDEHRWRALPRRLDDAGQSPDIGAFEAPSSVRPSRRPGTR